MIVNNNNMILTHGGFMIRFLILVFALISCKTVKEHQFDANDFQPDPIIYGATEEQPEKYHFDVNLINEINIKRFGKSKPKLAIDTALVCASEDQARFMAEKRICTHTGRNYSNFWQRAKKCGFIGNSGGEIIACGHKNAKDAVAAWIKSPGHNRIMFGNYKYIGCDMVGNMWVCVFGA